MISRILDFSVHQRWLVLLLSLLAAGFGGYALTKLPIDAVPDITNNQVQINTVAPSLSPIDIEKQVTYPVETALAGIKGLEYTRSLSRNGFSQVTAVFAEKLDIYFARQQVAERLSQVKQDLPPDAEPRMGPISTGLGEIYMWSIHYAKPGDRKVSQGGKPARALNHCRSRSSRLIKATGAAQSWRARWTMSSKPRSGGVSRMPNAASARSRASSSIRATGMTWFTGSPPARPSMAAGVSRARRRRRR